MPAARNTTRPHSGPRRPWVLDTRELSRRPGSSRTVRLTAPAPADLRAGMATVPEGSGLSLEILLEAVSDGVLVTLTATAPVTAECARCLEPFTSTARVTARELFSYPQHAGEAQEDGYSLDGDLLDLEPALRDALVLALPLAPRCRPDCPGLCAQCGVPLAVAGAGHGHGTVGDPRWAALRPLAAPATDGTAPAPTTGEENGRGRP
jgi:uncharacterized protein